MSYLFPTHSCPCLLPVFLDFLICIRILERKKLLRRSCLEKWVYHSSMIVDRQNAGVASAFEGNRSQQ